MNLNNEDKEFIKNLSHEMKTQDNRCTAQPYGLILLQEDEEIRPEGYGNDIMARFDDESYYDFDELMEYVEEYYGSDNEYVVEMKDEDISNFYEMQTSYEAEKLDIEVFNIERVDVPRKMQSNFFMTEKAYHDYIRRDGHNLNKPKSFGIHLTRNSEMEKLYEIIHKIAETL